MQFGYQDDPILVAQRAAAEASLAGAKSRGKEAQRRLLIQLGNPELARQILGADDPTLAQITGGPTSTMGRIKTGYEQGVRHAEEGFNAPGVNAFYSSARGKGLSELAQQRQMQEFDALQAAQGGLSNISEGLAGAEAAYREALISGDTGAYERAQQRALEFGIGPEPAAEPGGEPPPGGGGGGGTQQPGVNKLLRDLAKRAAAKATPPKPKPPLTPGRAAAKATRPRPLPKPHRPPGRRP